MQKKLGEKIRKMRQQKGLTQEQLAEQIGIDNKHLSRIENGHHFLTYNILRNLAVVLDFDIYELDKLEIKEPNKLFQKAVSILNSAKSDAERKYYLDVLQLAQKGLKLKRKIKDLQINKVVKLSTI